MPAVDPAPDDPVRRAVRGESTAAADLVRVHGPAVWGICRRLCTEPEDAYQEIWAKAFRALPEFDPDGPASFHTWLLVLAHRHLVDLHRRKKVRGEVVPLPERLSVPPVAEHRLEAADHHARLEQAMASLQPPHRRVVLMHHLHGVPLDRIAAEEGVAVGTIKSRLHRARARLAELLGDLR
ncbi:MAG: sigma-70 family RNA polymerase sigma factor [Alphaproteobacteria bacterium]|nr:sigma-70 family RNA polymerase sigma factor [Alphaproteobacteria bacterium]